MDCHECGHAQVLQDLQLHQPNTFNVYDLRCICGRHYCGVCGLSSHFPALCQERTLWQEYYMDRDEQFVGIYDHMLLNIAARRNMQGWRDQFGHDEYDAHPHMRFAVEELSRASSIHSWVRVTAHFSVIHGNILVSPEFLEMIDRHTALSNAVIATMNAQPPPHLD